jgi:sulfatase maturation enzyme AslB (radical SAM superfamily)
MKREPEIMDFKLFEKIIDKLEERIFRNYFTFFNGEPLLVPNFLDYLRLIRVKVSNAKVHLFTNASKLNEESGETIIKERLLDRLWVSFDGGTKESYESVRRNLSFESVKQKSITL